MAGVPWRSAGVPLLALLPGAYAWWTGRWLVRLRDDAALPERLQARGTRLAQLVGVAFAVTAILWPSSLLWAVPLLWLGLGVGSFPARRVLFEERWTLAEYLLARLRLVAAWPGPLLLLAAAPALVVAAGSARWAVATVLALALAGWNVRHPEVFRLLTEDGIRWPRRWHCEEDSSP